MTPFLYRLNSLYIIIVISCTTQRHIVNLAPFFNEMSCISTLDPLKLKPMAFALYVWMG